MFDLNSNGGTAAFAPEANDSLERLLEKTEGMLGYLAQNEGWLRKFRTGFVDERRAMWQGQAELLRRARTHSALAMDARLESQRVWAEEMRLTALVVVTMCVHLRSEPARMAFAGPGGPELLAELTEKMETSRPEALRLMAADELAALRKDGFLRAGE